MKRPENCRCGKSPDTLTLGYNTSEQQQQTFINITIMLHQSTEYQSTSNKITAEDKLQYFNTLQRK